MYLADLEERSYDEVASLTVGRNTVGSRVFRGRALLRERLASRCVLRVLAPNRRRELTLSTWAEVPAGLQTQADVLSRLWS